MTKRPILLVEDNPSDIKLTQRAFAKSNIANELVVAEDGQAALDWVASYLERVGELPVASSVSPGEIRARLPVSPPEHGEPFEAVLRDLDEAILPGITQVWERREWEFQGEKEGIPGGDESNFRYTEKEKAAD